MRHILFNVTEDLKHSTSIFDTCLISICCLLQRPFWPESLSASMQCKGAFGTELVSSQGASYLSPRVELWRNAVQELVDNRQRQLHSKISDHGRCITFCAKSERWRQACEVLSSYTDCRLEVNAISYNATISAFEKRVWMSSLSLLEELAWRRMAMSVVTSSTVISSQAGSQWERAMKVLDRMEVDFLQPNAITYTSMLSVCEQSNHWQSSLASLKDLELKSVEKHIFTVNSCITSCEKAAQWLSSLALFHSTQIQRDVVTYNGLRGSWWRMLQHLEALSFVSLSATVISYNATLAVFGEVSTWPQGVALLEKLHLQRVQATLTTYNALIDAMETVGAWRQALQVFNLLTKTVGLHPDVITYNTLISVCEKASIWQLSLYFFEALSTLSLQKDVITYNSTATSCVKASHWYNALAILQQANQVDEISCTVGLDALGKMAAWQSGAVWIEESWIGFQIYFVFFGFRFGCLMHGSLFADDRCIAVSVFKSLKVYLKRILKDAWSNPKPKKQSKIATQVPFDLRTFCKKRWNSI